MAETFNKAYDLFKSTLLSVRNLLKGDCSEEELFELQEQIEREFKDLVGAYDELRSCLPTVDITHQRKVDSASACKRDMISHLNCRISEVGVKEFDLRDEIAQLKALKQPYTASIYSADTVVSHQTDSRSIKDQATEAAADLAAKKVRFRALELEEEEAIHLAQLEAEREQMDQVVEVQRRKLKLLKARQEVEESNAKFQVLNAAVIESNENVAGELDTSPVSHHSVSTVQIDSSLNPRAPEFSPDPQPFVANLPLSNSPVSESSLVAALANAMDRNRLPVPTPKLFSGSPIEYVSFKRSFKTLIENKGISAEEKIYYLQQYVVGDARESIAGCLYGTNEEDYQRAWQTLEKRFGHPFKVQESFRDKLDKWPKVGNKDSVALQRYADFLRSCLDAMPHVKGLTVLNDCKENQKMTSKLPDWAITRWSRIVSESLDSATEYPTFKQFVAFVEKEARAACHPVASISAVKGADSKPQRDESRKFKEIRSLATDQVKSPDKVSRKRCSFCEGEHYLSGCAKFAESDIAQRNAFIQENKRCFGCLRTGHLVKQCKARHTCQKCKGRHPTVLHDNNREKKPIQKSPEDNEKQEKAASLNADHGHSSTTNVVPVWVSTADSPQIERLVYALLDTQSDSTFIEEKVCEELSTATDPVKLKLSTLLGKDVTVTCKRAKGLRVRGYTSTQYVDLPPAYTRDFIPLDREHIPTCETAKSWNHLANIATELPPLLDCEVGLLIGYNCSTALAPSQVITGENGQPYAVKTTLGWSIVGSIASVNSTDVTGFCHRVSLKEAPPVTPRDVLSVLESDFKDSSYGDVSTSQEDIQFLKILESSIVRNERGHIEMPLPFRSRPNLPNNRKLAVKRLCHLKKRLDSDPKYKEHYTQFIEEMLENGHAEPASDAAKTGELYYIPHHGVYHPKKPDKLRVVFDCSARYRGNSLNDHLLSGPDLTNNLLGVLCRFRRYPIAVMCDIEKMFHQFHVTLTDRNYLRFLWWEEGDTSKEPQEYRMNVHLFGATSSPGCANFGLKYLSRMFERDYPLAAPFLCQDYYVDDGVTSLQSVEEAVRLIRESRELCAQGNLHLHKFVTNDLTVMESIPLSERATEIQEVDLNSDKLPVERTLGTQWSIESDTFTFHIHEKERPDTRRGILSIVASIFDPIGLISPLVLQGKAILQEMCKRGVSWDDPIPEALMPRWENWKSDIQNLKEIQIPRCYKPADFGPVTRTELHHFSDASTEGYGVCSYLRFVSTNRVHCSLVVSKARVSPTKVVTIPRMELTAAVIAVKISCKLKEELQMKIDSEQFWCDSQIVLAYINNEAKRFHVFVANRVQFIREHTKVDQWLYVSTKNNPADHASRGLRAAELMTSNWFTGPEFLWNTDTVEKSLIKSELMLGDPEVRVQALNVQLQDSNNLMERLRRYSDWNLVMRIVARIRRLVHSSPENKFLTVEEMNQAGLCVIKLVQEVAFKVEIQALSKNQEVASTSKLYSLSPHIKDGVIRVGGRLRKSSLLVNQKYPVVLPRDGHITRLIIAHCHSQIHHQGRGQTLNQIRSQGYWILGGSKVVADFIRNCVHCRRLRRPAEEQKMADLPEDRVEPSPPFSFCGMDCFGPFITKYGRKEYKRYGLLFTCLCSRAVHIEMLEDMTTDSFIIGLRSFIAIRGTVTQIRSDQGSNFVGASNELSSALKELDIDRVTTFLSKKQCTFIFNAPSSSHAAGVWERQIRSIRNVLSSSIAMCQGRVDDASLRCMFYEAMLIINSRPLTTVNSDLSEEPLTPNHLITMKRTTPLPPPGKFVKEDVYARKRWRRIQYIMEQFWSQWKREYLLNLSRRQKWNVSRRNVQVGDIVMLMDAETPRMEWPLAIIVEAQKDDDGLVRRVKARLSTSNLDKDGKPDKQPVIRERPIQKVVLLLEASD